MIECGDQPVFTMSSEKQTASYKSHTGSESDPDHLDSRVPLFLVERSCRELTLQWRRLPAKSERGHPEAANCADSEIGAGFAGNRPNV